MDIASMEVYTLSLNQGVTVHRQKSILLHFILLTDIHTMSTRDIIMKTLYNNNLSYQHQISRIEEISHQVYLYMKILFLPSSYSLSSSLIVLLSSYLPYRQDSCIPLVVIVLLLVATCCKVVHEIYKIILIVVQYLEDSSQILYYY